MQSGAGESAAIDLDIGKLGHDVAVPNRIPGYRCGVTEHPGAQSYLPERRSLKALRQAVQDCRGCDLYRDATQAVFGDGPAHPDLVVVGEQPGDVEDRRGEPFVGPAGGLLDRAMETAGIDPDRVYRTNAVKHFRFREMRGKRRIHAKPDASQIKACGPWLQAELSTLRPNGVLVLGASAGRAVLGPSFRVGAMRGRVLDPPEGIAAAWMVATTHPSAVLRSRERDRDFQALVDDLRIVEEQLGTA